jgi:hypothetical protein
MLRNQNDLVVCWSQGEKNMMVGLSPDVGAVFNEAANVILPEHGPIN